MFHPIFFALGDVELVELLQAEAREIFRGFRGLLLLL
jgi:hypothetical protein